MKIYIIRHGITELNKQGKVNGQINEPLAPEGIEQAKTVVLPPSILSIYASPFLRTTQTAKIINARLGLPIHQHDGLREIHMGSLAGKAWAEMDGGLELKKKHRSVQFDYLYFGGESATQVKKRVLDFLKEINGKHKDHEALIVTHGGIIRVLHYLEKGETFEEDIEHISPYIFDLSKIFNHLV